MYLAYLDESGRRKRDRKFQVLSAIIVKDELFSYAELVSAASLAEILPREKVEKFEEFHAFELFNGIGIFTDIDQPTRFGQIEHLLRVIQDHNVPIVFGAVNESELQNRNYGSANPIDIGFRICARGVENWMVRHEPEQFAVFIADEFEGETKTRLKRSFREFRKQIRPPYYDTGILEHVHDSMYFGDSKDSVGIQLADLCSYIIAKHIEGDPAVAGFYQLIQEQIVHSEIEPKDNSTES